MDFLTHFTIAIFSLIAIVLSCIIFTNAIEYLGEKLSLNSNAVGSILAVLGTGLPETIVPIVAILGSIFISKDLNVGQEIALGAIFGSPFMLSSFALFILGILFAILIFKKKRENIFKADYKNITRDYKYFSFAYFIALSATFTTNLQIKYLIALGLIILYFLFAYRTILRSKTQNEGQEKLKLYFKKFLNPQNDFQNNIILFSQIALSLLLLLFSTHFFVEEIKYFSICLNLNPAILSLVITPFATELPEITNSIIWFRQGKDELALSNIIGAIVFQATILCALGIILTPWVLNLSILINCILTIFCACLFVFFALKTKKITLCALISCGLFYFAYILFLILK